MLNSEIYQLDPNIKKQLEQMMISQLGKQDQSINPSETLIDRGIFFPDTSFEEICPTQQELFHNTNIHSGESAYPLFSVPFTSKDGRKGQLIVVRARFSNAFETARSLSHNVLPSLRGNP